MSKYTSVKKLKNPEWSCKYRQFLPTKVNLFFIRTETKILRKGCSCKGSCSDKPSHCNCIVNNQECKPNVCLCFSTVSPELSEIISSKPVCQNTFCWYLVYRDTIVKRTKICLGMGLFADKDYPVNCFLGFYGGEYIFKDEEARRNIRMKLTDSSYIFSPGDKGSQVDALYLGNNTRYINHMKIEYANIDVKILDSMGRKFVVFYSKKLIKKGEELFFDYGDKYGLQWKIDFDKKVLKYSKEKNSHDRALKAIKYKKNHSFEVVKNITGL